MADELEQAMVRRNEWPMPTEYTPPPPLEGDDLAQAVEALEAARANRSV